MVNELLPEIIQSIKTLREQKDSLSDELLKIKSQLNTNKQTTDAYSDNVKSVRDKLEDTQKQISTLEDKIQNKSNFMDNITNLVKAIPIPKNGIDGKDGKTPTIDYKKINDFIFNEVQKIEVEVEKVDYNKIFNKVQEYINNLNIPIPKDGADGKDGVGIKSIKKDKSDLIIELTNNKIQRFKFPLPDMKVGGGVSEVDFKETLDNVTSSVSLNNVSRTYICDCSNGDITITLPVASISVSNNQSVRISIIKKDNTANIVKIVSQDGQIFFSNSQELTRQGEVINLITDGTDWYLGA